MVIRIGVEESAVRIQRPAPLEGIFLSNIGTILLVLGATFGAAALDWSGHIYFQITSKAGRFQVRLYIESQLGPHERLRYH